MQETTLLVLAAGMGSRYGGLKQLDPMGPNGETILDYSVYDAIQAGFSKVVFIIRKSFAEEFEARAHSLYAGRIEIEFVYQELDHLPEGFTCPAERTKPWGTAHAIWVAKEKINEPFAVINADDYYGTGSFQLAQDYLSKLDADSKQFGMVAYKLENTLSENGGVNRGIVTATNGTLQSVKETTQIEKKSDSQAAGVSEDGSSISLALTAPVSMNYWLFSPALFNLLDEFLNTFFTDRLNEEKSESYIPTVVDEAIKNGNAECAVQISDDKWFGVTYPDDKALVQAALTECLTQGVYPTPLFPSST